MIARTKAWQCGGCGRLESQQTCIGICQDHPVEIVSAVDYDALRREADALRLFIRQLALISPRTGEWERSYKALQEGARRLLADPAEDLARAA